MKFLHISDLHIGKRLNDYSLFDDQKEILNQAVNVYSLHNCESVIIAGDIYDKSVPSAEAMNLFNNFITSLSELGAKVYMISGNHDSPERISYYSSIIKNQGIYAPEAFSGKLQSIECADSDITIHLLPFIKPANVRPFYPEKQLNTYEQAINTVIENSIIDENRINILVCHQFITGGKICDSEEFAVGGLDSVSAEVFNRFDYVALGHLHQAQRCGRETVRYAGSPLKYSLSEEFHNKSFTIVDVREKRDIIINTVPIKLLHDVKTIRGSFEELMNKSYTEDYIRVIITDDVVSPDARIALRSVFPNMLKFSIENSKTSYEADTSSEESIVNKSPEELFSDFYALQNNGVYPNEKQLEIVRDIFNELEDVSE